MDAEPVSAWWQLLLPGVLFVLLIVLTAEVDSMTAAAWVTAAATVATVFVAYLINRGAARIATGQKEIAGLTILREIYAPFYSSDSELRRARERFITGYLRGSLDELATYEVLDFLEEIGLLVDKGYVTPDIVSEMMFYVVIAFWYACVDSDCVRELRSESAENWGAIARLVCELHKIAKKDGSQEWAGRPGKDTLRKYFIRHARRLGLVASSTAIV